MTFVERFKTGLYMAAQSLFMLLTAEKKLLLYFGIPALTSVIIKLIAYNVWVIPLNSPLELLSFSEKLVSNVLVTNHEIIQFMLVALIHITTTIVTVFFNVALMHHIAHIFQGDETTIREALAASLNKKKAIALWSILIVSIELLCQFSEDMNSVVIGFAITLLAVLFLIGTFFVLPLISFKNNALLTNIAESMNMTKKNIVEIIGGTTWIAMITVVILAPFAILVYLAGPTFLPQILKNPGVYPTTLFCILFVTEIVMRCILWTAYSIFKVMLYQQYRRQYPDAGEIEMMSYAEYF